MKRLSWLALWLVCALVTMTVQAENTIWQIGRADHSAAEFSLAPSHYQDHTTRFPAGCYYEIGASQPSDDWSYVLPGPRDGWAGSSAHSATIVFALDQAPNANCRLELAFVDTHNYAPPRLHIQVNGQSQTFRLPAGGPDDSINGDYAKGKPAQLNVDLPAGQLVAGNNVIQIVNNDGSWCIFDSLTLKGSDGPSTTAIKPDTRIVNTQTGMFALRGPGDTCLSPVDLTILHTSEPVKVQFQSGNKTLSATTLKRGLNTIQLSIPSVDAETTLPLKLVIPNTAAIQTSVTIQPVRKWEVHLIHQTHLDIGYTHPQEDVLQLQVDHLKKALAYIEASKDYPPEAQFKWHPEGMWAVEEFFRTATDAEKTAFINAARTGHIHLDAFYAQAMTCIYSDEELFELLASAKQFERDYQVPVLSATSSDIPGFAWGAVPVLAQNGVRYFSVAPNRVHRIGHVFDWGDKPFWWQSPSGQEKILFWMSGKDYSHFHGQPIGHRITPQEIMPVLQEMQDKGYPYDLMHLRYNIGADNGPPNPVLPEVVHEWNKKYAWPRLIISTNSAMFQEFEKRYGDQLPTLRGDFTGHWEDGAASTAADTAIDRQARDALVQAQILWTLHNPKGYPYNDFKEAWTNAIMYDEHTWGAWNSISEPDSEFAIRQAVYKQKFALNAAAQTSRLLNQALASEIVGTPSTIDIYNTANWPRTDLVILTADQSRIGDQVIDAATNRTIPSQRLQDGSLAFVAQEVPPLGAKRYQIKSALPLKSGSAQASGHTLSNSILSITVNPDNGAISSLKTKSNNAEWVRPDSAGLNDYLYIIGRDATKNHQLIEGPVTITVQDPGPLVATLVIESGAPGCNKLTRKLRLVDGLDTLAIENITDKLKERRPESVFFAFPLNITGGQWRLDIPWAIMRPERDQLPGANRNFFTMQRWADLSNKRSGLTLVSLDAPMVEFDPIFTRPYSKEDWRTQCQPDQTFWSWVMNNHWETNYKADQEGIITFRYVLRPHSGPFDPAGAEQLALHTCRPLLVAPADPSQPAPQFPWKLNSRDIIISAIKPIAPAGTLLRLFNPTSEPAVATLSASGSPLQVQHCSPIGEPLEPLQPRLTLKPMEILNIRINQ